MAINTGARSRVSVVWDTWGFGVTFSPRTFYRFDGKANRGMYRPVLQVRVGPVWWRFEGGERV